MKKIAMVYYSGTGNTEAMADIIADELRDKAEVIVADPSSFGPADMDKYDAFAFGCPAMGNEVLEEDMDKYDAFAFGCPAMGNEVLEEDTYEPMFAAIEGSLEGKRIILFGSYGWGDGEWMRNWEERCRNAGAILAADPVIANEAPDDDAAAALKAAADALIS